MADQVSLPHNPEAVQDLQKHSTPLTTPVTEEAKDVLASRATEFTSETPDFADGLDRNTLTITDSENNSTHTADHSYFTVTTVSRDSHTMSEKKPAKVTLPLSPAPTMATRRSSLTNNSDSSVSRTVEKYISAAVAPLLSSTTTVAKKQSDSTNNGFSSAFTTTVERETDALAPYFEDYLTLIEYYPFEMAFLPSYVENELSSSPTSGDYNDSTTTTGYTSTAVKLPQNSSAIKNLKAYLRDRKLKEPVVKLCKFPLISNSTKFQENYILIFDFCFFSKKFSEKFAALLFVLKVKFQG